MRLTFYSTLGIASCVEAAKLTQVRKQDSVEDMILT